MKKRPHINVPLEQTAIERNMQHFDEATGTLDSAISSLAISTEKCFGDQNVDGSFRIRMSGSSLLIERREDGAWVEKGSF